MINFEFDVAKSRANKRKHGIDFVEVQALWGMLGPRKSLSRQPLSLVLRLLV